MEYSRKKNKSLLQKIHDKFFNIDNAVSYNNREGYTGKPMQDFNFDKNCCPSFGVLARKS